jgi:catechol 2,3-dioxygenase-like lactoylglutathione lyase family enzyme
MGVRAIGINHVAFEVDDLDQALEWYRRYFDFTLRGRNPTMAWIDLGDQFLALSQRPDGSEPSPDRARHVGFVVEDKEALRQALQRGGEDVNPSGSLRVRDPSGNQLEIVDYRDIQFSKTPTILSGMGLEDLAKNPSAVQELRDKGLG